MLHVGAGKPPVTAKFTFASMVLELPVTVMVPT